MATAPVIAHLRGGFRTELAAGPHRLVADEPIEVGGTATGPTPYDLLSAALASCTAMTLEFYARREKLPLAGVDVSVAHDRQHAKDCADCITQAGFIHRFRVEIALHGPLTAEQRQRLVEVANRCPVARTLQSEIKVDDVLAAES
jgi:putative redox protein